MALVSCFQRTMSHFLSCLSLVGSNITVSLSSNSSEIMEGETIQLTCVVSNTVGPLSMTWQWTDKDGAGPAVNVASVDREGTVTPGPTFRERSSYGEVRVERVRPDTFTLFLYNAFPTDEGQYRCSAAEWSQSGTAPEWIWQQIGDESAIKTVTVKSVGKTTYTVWGERNK